MDHTVISFDISFLHHRAVDRHRFLHQEEVIKVRPIKNVVFAYGKKSSK
jgi:hypothetical protein